MKLLAILLVLVGCSSRYKISKPFLYEVSKGDRKAILFGTIHTGVVAKDLPEGLWTYFDRADAFAGEVDLTKDQPLIAKRVSERMKRRSDQPSIQDQLPAKEFKKLRDLVAQQYPKEVDGILNHLSMLGALGYVAEQQKKSADVEIRSEYVTIGHLQRMTGKLDQELTERAIMQQKPVHRLDDLNSDEFIDCAIAIVYGPQSEYAENLVKMLNQERVKLDLNEYIEMTDAYRSGNAHYFERESTQSACMFEDRNELWIGKILSMMGTYKTPFIAMGVAHLEHSSETVLKMLKADGFVVKRISIK